MGSFDPAGDNQRGGSRWTSLIIALLVVGFGLFTYYSNTEVNPITGEKQRVSISPEQEIRLGIQAAPEMAAQMGGAVPASDPRAQNVQRIGDEVVNKTTAHKGPWKFQFHLLADPKTINAFALPGGQIFITLGLYNRLKTEAQLAGVLGHEAGHVIQRHAAQQMAKGQLGKLLVLATGIGIGSGDPNNQGAVIANVVNQMTQLHYGRNDELEADLWGLKLMREAGYTPRAMLEVMKILEQASPSGQQPEFMLTHPYPEHRMEKIQAYLKEHPPSPELTEGRSLDRNTGLRSNADSDSEDNSVESLLDLLFRNGTR